MLEVPTAFVCTLFPAPREIPPANLSLPDGGNQQYTVRDFQFIAQAKACICLIWDWGWTWSGLYLSSSPVGISLINPQGSNGGGAITGSTYVMDSTFFDISVGLEAEFNKTILESSIIILDNLELAGVGTVVTYANGDVLEGIPTDGIDFVVIGNVESNGASYGQYKVPVATRAPDLVVSQAYQQPLYYTRSRPQYETLPTSSIINVKDHGAKEMDQLTIQPPSKLPWTSPPHPTSSTSLQALIL